MNYLYYPGCSLHSTAEEFDLSTRSVFQALGMTLEELADWNCCGATPGHALGGEPGLSLPLRNLVLAQRRGKEIILPCAACYNVFRVAAGRVEAGDEEAAAANAVVKDAVGEGYAGGLKITHPLATLTDESVLSRIRELVTRPLEGLKVAPYYGCLLTRPPEMVAFDDPEQPTSMDRLLQALGAEVVRWSYKTACCGASLVLPRGGFVQELSGRIAREALRAGADVISVACPMCHSNLESRQGDASVPILFITELIGLSFGLKDAGDWLSRHLVDPRPVLKEAMGS